MNLNLWIVTFASFALSLGMDWYTHRESTRRRPCVSARRRLDGRVGDAVERLLVDARTVVAVTLSHRDAPPQLTCGIHAFHGRSDTCATCGAPKRAIATRSMLEGRVAG